MFLISDTLRSSAAFALYDAHRERGWTYRELCDAVQQTATLFASRRKALFFLFCRNDVASVIGYLAAVEAGHAVALLNGNLAPEFKARLIELYQPEFIVSSVPTATLGIELIGSTFSQASLGDPPLYVWSSDAERADAVHSDLALLLATGEGAVSSKLVRLTKQNLESNARAIGTALRITAEEKPITSLPMDSAYGLSVINSHLAAGAEIVLTDFGVMTPDFWDVFREQDCTSLAGDTSLYTFLRQSASRRPEVSSLQTMTQAAGTLPTDVTVHFHQWMAERGGRFYVMYGQPEATGQVCILSPEVLPDKLGSCGCVIEGGALAVQSSAALTTEAGVTGEVFYRGPNVMLGYAGKRKDLRLGDQLRGTLPMGDFGYLDAEGYLFLTGRKKRDADPVLAAAAP